MHAPGRWRSSRSGSPSWISGSWHWCRRSGRASGLTRPSPPCKSAAIVYRRPFGVNPDSLVAQALERAGPRLAKFAVRRPEVVPDSPLQSRQQYGAVPENFTDIDSARNLHPKVWAFKHRWSYSEGRCTGPPSKTDGRSWAGTSLTSGTNCRRPPPPRKSQEGCFRVRVQIADAAQNHGLGPSLLRLFRGRRRSSLELRLQGRLRRPGRPSRTTCAGGTSRRGPRASC